MTVLSESKMARDSYVVLFRHTTADQVTLVNAITTSPWGVRNVGGSTIASSSEGYCKLDNSDHIGFLVGWACTGINLAHTLTVHKGDGWRGVLGDLDILLTPTATGSTAASAVKILAGPFESARFAIVATNTSQSHGVIGEQFVKFSFASTGTTDCEAQYVQVKPFRWPDVQYAT